MNKFYLVLMFFALLFVGCEKSNVVEPEVKSVDQKEEVLKFDKVMTLDDFKVISSTKGVKLYKYSNIYVQEIHMNKSKVISLANCISSTGLIKKYSINTFWKALKKDSNTKNVFSVSNLSFFIQNGTNLVKLSYPYKQKTTKIKGYATDNLNNRKMLMLKKETNNLQQVIIANYSNSLFNNSKFNYVSVGLDVSVKKNPYVRLGRTYVGVSYKNGTKDPILLIVHTKASWQSTMKKTLLLFGCSSSDSMIQFDGSGSSQLKTSNVSIYGDAGFSPDYRHIPNVLCVIPKK